MYQAQKCHWKEKAILAPASEEYQLLNASGQEYRNLRIQEEKVF
jgi:hypothetical protein